MKLLIPGALTRGSGPQTRFATKAKLTVEQRMLKRVILATQGATESEAPRKEHTPSEFPFT